MAIIKKFRIKSFKQKKPILKLEKQKKFMQDKLREAGAKIKDLED